MKYNVVDKYVWHFPDEGIEVSTYREPTYFRRFFMWLFLNAEFRVYYETVDTASCKKSVAN